MAKFCEFQGICRAMFSWPGTNVFSQEEEELNERIYKEFWMTHNFIFSGIGVCLQKPNTEKCPRVQLTSWKNIITS